MFEVTYAGSHADVFDFRLRAERLRRASALQESPQKKQEVLLAFLFDLLDGGKVSLKGFAMHPARSIRRHLGIVISVPIDATSQASGSQIQSLMSP